MESIRNSMMDAHRKRHHQPVVFLLIFPPGYHGSNNLLTVYTLYFENNRSGSIVAASNHYPVILCPAMHDTPALECGINITTDSVPCLRAKRDAFTSAMSSSWRLQAVLVRNTRFNQCPLAAVPIVISSIVPIKNKFITNIVTGAFSAIWNGTILCLKFWKSFFINYSHFTFIFHSFPSKF